MEGRDVLVYCQLERGQWSQASLEALGPAGQIARDAGGRVLALAIGKDLDRAQLRSLGAYGANVVYAVEGEEYSQYSTQAYTHALSQANRLIKPTALLIGSTAQGRDLAPRVAARLKTGLTADVIAVEQDTDRDCVRWIMPAYGGKLLAAIVCQHKRPQMATIRPGNFKLHETPGALAKIQPLALPFPKEGIGTSLVCSVAKTIEAASLRQAQIVVAGGYGCRDQAGFDMVVQLAQALGGAVGASRAAIDAGWASEDLQIGQSGLTVRPKLYIACGISGAIQHTAGVKGSGTMLAINTDPHAPIFSVAEYGVVADLRSFIPSLLAQLERRKS